SASSSAPSSAKSGPNATRPRSARWRRSSPASRATEAALGGGLPGNAPENALENSGPARAQLAAGRPALVWRKLVADTETPVGAALKLIEPGRGDFLLESVEGGEVRGRYSLLGLDPDLMFRATGHACEVNRKWR